MLPVCWSAPLSLESTAQKFESQHDGLRLDETMKMFLFGILRLSWS